MSPSCLLYGGLVAGLECLPDDMPYPELGISNVGPRFQNLAIQMVSLHEAILM